MKKKRTYIIEYYELTREQQEVVREDIEGESHSNGSSFYVEIEDEENPSNMEKLLIELGYKVGQSVLLRLSW